MYRDFLEPGYLYKILNEKNINFFTGVPDSLLKPFCDFVTDNVGAENHIIASNEGNAIGIAAGHYLGSQQIPVVYF